VKSISLLPAAFLVLLVVFGFGGYKYVDLAKKNSVLGKELADAREKIASSEAAKADVRAEFATERLALEQEIKNLRTQISGNEQEKNELATALEAERQSVGALANKVSEVTGAVSTIERLSHVDPELLQKYSKVYFLNENYEPRSLTVLPAAYLFEPSRNQTILSGIFTHLEKLMAAATEANTDIKIVSAYRSFTDQTVLKGQYKVEYGAGANKFSADQGYSEHQLGTAIDFSATGLPAIAESFDKSSAFKWLSENAHKYGFTLSYPKGNNFYVYEPWHWRFVGVELAALLKNSNKHFYDFEQRQINDFLIRFFDPPSN